MVLDVDPHKRRISLGLKQCLDNPWDSFSEKFPAGSVLEGDVKNITEFGLFVGLPGVIDGMVHLSDLSWTRAGEEVIQEFKKGQIVNVKVLDVDVDKERISLGMKQLADDPFKKGAATIKKGAVVTCTVSQITDGGIEVSVGDNGLTGFIRKSDLSRDRSEQRPDRFAVGEKVDAKVTQFDRASRKVTLSIKAREVQEEKQAMAEYGSSDSGASLGDILGAALKRAQEATDDDGAEAEAEAEPDEPAPKAKKAAAKKTKATKKAKADDTAAKTDDAAEAKTDDDTAAKTDDAAEAKTDDDAAAKTDDAAKAKTDDDTAAKADDAAAKTSEAK